MLSLDFIHPPLGFSSVLAEVPSEEAEPLILAGVLLSLMVVYLARKLGGELSKLIGLPPVLGELVSGVLVGVSALHLLVFPGVGVEASSSVLMNTLQTLMGTSGDTLSYVFETQGEIISVLAELGVIILLFEIGLESDLKELQKVGWQAALVAIVGVVAPFARGTVGLMGIFHVAALPAIFAGAALTATSIGITSKVLSELGQLRSREGQIIVGAAPSWMMSSASSS